MVSRVAIIGAGWYGCHLGSSLKALGFDVRVFEQHHRPLHEASGNNQFRLHLGFHYPRHHGTRVQSRDGFARFMERYPQVNVQVIATNRRVDLIAERVDLALRMSPLMDIDAAFTVKKLLESSCILVASPAWARRLGEGRDVEALSAVPTLSLSEHEGQDTWTLLGPEQRTFTLQHTPRLSCGDCPTLRAAAICGLGVALLPEAVCGPALRSGQLVQVFPDWSTQQGGIHLVYTSRRGLPPPVSALITYLTEHVRQLQCVNRES